MGRHNVAPVYGDRRKAAELRDELMRRRRAGASGRVNRPDLADLLVRAGATNQDQQRRLIERLARTAKTTPDAVILDWAIEPPPGHMRRFEQLLRTSVKDSERATRPVPDDELGSREHCRYWLEPLGDDSGFLELMADEAGLSWCAPGIDPFDFLTGPDWLGRVLGTASVVGELLIEPHRRTGSGTRWPR